MSSAAFEPIEYELLPRPVFVPLFERENYRDDGTGVLDHTMVMCDGVVHEVTNFDVIQDAFRNCVPPKKMHYGGAWSQEAKKTNSELREKLSRGAITSQEVFESFVVGVYMQDLTAE